MSKRKRANIASNDLSNDLIEDLVDRNCYPIIKNRYI